MKIEFLCGITDFSEAGNYDVWSKDGLLVFSYFNTNLRSVISDLVQDMLEYEGHDIFYRIEKV